MNELYCLGCQRWVACKTYDTGYEGKTYKLTACNYCWQVWNEFVMVNGNRYRKVEKMSFIKKHEKSVVVNTVKHMLAEIESRRLMALQDKLDAEVEIVDSSEVEPDEDTLYAEYLYRRMNGSQD
jgi:hypothetical protein